MNQEAIMQPSTTLSLRKNFGGKTLSKGFSFEICFRIKYDFWPPYDITSTPPKFIASYLCACSRELTANFPHQQTHTPCTGTQISIGFDYYCHCNVCWYMSMLVKWKSQRYHKILYTDHQVEQQQHAQQ